MQVSYSCHIGGIQNTGALTGAGKHNERQYQDIRSIIKYRQEHENWRDKDHNTRLRGSDNLKRDVEETYKKEFEEALKKYNDQQKRDDRKKGDYKDYLKEVSNGKQNVAIEMIVQIGSKENWQGVDIDTRKNMTEVFKNQLEYMEKNLPDFKISHAVIHYDESSPHLHVVGVPIGRGYQKGMEVRVSQREVFNKETLRNELQKGMREQAEKDMKARFKDIEFKEKEQGRKFSKSVGAYKEYMNKTQELERQIREQEHILEQRARVRDKEKDINQFLDKEDKTLLGYIKPSAKGLSELVEQVNQDKKDKELLREQTSLIGHLSQENKRLDEHNYTLIEMVKEQQKEIERLREQERTREREHTRGREHNQGHER